MVIVEDGTRGPCRSGGRTSRRRSAIYGRGEPPSTTGVSHHRLGETPPLTSTYLCARCLAIVGPLNQVGAELVPELEFVGEAIEARAGWMVDGRRNDQHGAPLPVTAAEDALTVFPGSPGAIRGNAQRKRALLVRFRRRPRGSIRVTKVREIDQDLSRGCADRAAASATLPNRSRCAPR